MATELILPDSGPLMSLGRINRLDLLDRFQCPILITDMVADEVLRGLPGAPDAEIFKSWFDARGNQVQTVETSIGLLWKSVPEDKKEVLKRIKDAGETSIWQFSNTLKQTMAVHDDALLIFEDSKIKGIDFGLKVSKATTWSFLLGLERAGIIPSAEEIVDQIASRDRIIAKDPFEQNALERDVVSSWIDAYEK